jgi:acetyltransferase EpsM
VGQGLVIWGAGGHALVVADIIHLTQDYVIAGFLDSVNPARSGQAFCGASVLGGEEQLERLRRIGVEHIIVAVGDGRARLHLAKLARSKGLQLASAVHPRAVVAKGVPIGAGTVVAAGAVVGPGTVIGENVIVNTCASVDHECAIGDGAHIAPGAHLGGGVTVGCRAHVGIGAAVRERIRIGAGSLVGAGAVVVSDVPVDVVAFGVPARVVWRVAEGNES